MLSFASSKLTKSTENTHDMIQTGSIDSRIQTLSSENTSNTCSTSNEDSVIIIPDGKNDSIEKSNPDSDFRTASFSSTTVVSINNIVGGALVSMPWCAAQAGILSFIISTVIIGILTILSFILVAQCCEISGKYTFREIGHSVVGPIYGIIILTIMSLYSFTACVVYVIIVADSLCGETGVISKVFDSFPQASWLVNLFMSRPLSMLIITVVVLFPLSYFKRLHSYRFTSMISIGLMFFFIVFVIYTNAELDENGKSPGDINWVEPRVAVLQVNPIMVVSFSAHYNLPKYYRELKDRSITNFSKISIVSIVFSGIIYIAVGIAGYLAFGNNTAQNVIDNRGFDPKLDIVASISFALLVIFAFPISFDSIRSGFAELLNYLNSPLNPEENKVHFILLTLGILLGIFAFGGNLNNVANFLALKGIIFGCFVAFVIPAVTFLAMMSERFQFCHRRYQKQFRNDPPDFKFWIVVSYTLIISSFIIIIGGIVGLTL